MIAEVTAEMVRWLAIPIGSSSISRGLLIFIILLIYLVSQNNGGRYK